MTEPCRRVVGCALQVSGTHARADRRHARAQPASSPGGRTGSPMLPGCRDPPILRDG
ncbi:hypothetical protein GS425_11750 [Rhodococcus hoagii]|nr:hypothetical protein [Prescottella equi]